MGGGGNSDAETTGWVAALSKSISSPFASFFNSSMDTDMVSQLEENQQKQDEIYPPAPAPAPAPINHVDNGKAADSWLYFCIKIRLEGKHGTKNVRIPYNQVLHTYDDLLDASLQRYLPADAKPFDRDDYSINIDDIADPSFAVAIESTEDLEMACNAPFANRENCLKLTATIQLKSDPPVVPEPVAAACRPPVVVDMSGDSSASALSSSGGKPVATVTPTKKSPPKKKRKTSRKSVVGGSKIPTRTKVIRALAELRALGNPNPPRKQVAIFADYTCIKSNGFVNALKSLKADGMLTYPGNKSVTLTNLGLQTPEAKGAVPPKNNAEVHARMKGLLEPKQREIFDLLAVDGHAYLRDEVSLAVGYTCQKSNGWVKSLSKMKSLGIVYYPGKKWIQLTDQCFPFSKQQADIVSSTAAAYRAETPRDDYMTTAPARVEGQQLSQQPCSTYSAPSNELSDVSTSASTTSNSSLAVASRRTGRKRTQTRLPNDMIDPLQFDSEEDTNPGAEESDHGSIFDV